MFMYMWYHHSSLTYRRVHHVSYHMTHTHTHTHTNTYTHTLSLSLSLSHTQYQHQTLEHGCIGQVSSKAHAEVGELRRACAWRAVAERPPGVGQAALRSWQAFDEGAHLCLLQAEKGWATPDLEREREGERERGREGERERTRERESESERERKRERERERERERGGGGERERESPGHSRSGWRAVWW